MGYSLAGPSRGCSMPGKRVPQRTERGTVAGALATLWPMGVADDRELIERCVARAPQSGDDFLARFEGVIWRTIHHFTRGAGHDVQEDVFQEVLLDLFSNGLASFRWTYPPISRRTSPTWR